MKKNSIGEIKYCPGCKSEQQTTCSACGCGSCTVCGWRWSCYGYSGTDWWQGAVITFELPKIKKDDEQFIDGAGI